MANEFGSKFRASIREMRNALAIGGGGGRGTMDSQLSIKLLEGLRAALSACNEEYRNFPGGTWESACIALGRSISRHIRIKREIEMCLRKRAREGGEGERERENG